MPERIPMPDEDQSDEAREGDDTDEPGRPHAAPADRHDPKSLA